METKNYLPILFIFLVSSSSESLLGIDLAEVMESNGAGFSFEITGMLKRH